MRKIEQCLVCGSSEVRILKDMGDQPLVNNLKNSPLEIEHSFPLVLNGCSICSHKQLSIAVNRELLFSNYIYQTGVSTVHRDFFMDFFWDLPKKNGHVLDIGSNDGTLLSTFLGWKCLGIEPSIELAKISRDKGIETICGFFPLKERIKEKFDIITAFNVLAHNDNPFDFLCKCKKLLKTDGRIFILTTPARIDNFYHEHISYFTLVSMGFLARRCDLEIVSFKVVTMHQESYLFELKEEKCEKINEKLSFPQPLVSYGASASGITLMNLFNISPEYVIDDNELKQGKFVPGINKMIYSSDHLAKDTRDLNILITAHHIYDEIVTKVKKLRPKKKDKFFHPLKGKM